MHTGHFVGYSSLKELLDQARNIQATLFADTFAEIVPEGSGFERRCLLIQVAFVEGSICHLWRWTIGSILYTPQGEAFEPDQEKRLEQLSNSAWALIRTHLLEEAPQSVVFAVAATPNHLTLINGSCPAFIRRNKEENLYQPAPALEAHHVS